MWGGRSGLGVVVLVWGGTVMMCQAYEAERNMIFMLEEKLGRCEHGRIRQVFGCPDCKATCTGSCGCPGTHCLCKIEMAPR